MVCFGYIAIAKERVH